MIDKNPAKGRYVLLETMFTDGFVGPSGLITKVSKGRIYYVPCTTARGFDVPADDRVEKYVYNISCVCDTIDEVRKLQEYSWDCVERIMKMRESHKSGYEQLLKIANNG